MFGFGILKILGGGLLGAGLLFGGLKIAKKGWNDFTGLSDCRARVKTLEKELKDTVEESSKYVIDPREDIFKHKKKANKCADKLEDKKLEISKCKADAKRAIKICKARTKSMADKCAKSFRDWKNK